MITLSEKLKQIAAQNPNKIAISEKTGLHYKNYTYSNFYKEALNIAEILLFFGCKKGEKIAIILDNCPTWGFLYFGILEASCIAVALDPESKENELSYYLENSESKIVFCHNRHLPLLQNAAKIESLRTIVSIDKENAIENKNGYKNKLIFLLSLKEKIAANTNTRTTKASPSPEDIASILYTSGTTGKPKGVMLTHKNFFANYSSISKLNFIQSEDKILSLLPLHHAFPFMTNLIVPLFSGATIIYPKTTRSEEILECMREKNTSVLVAVPQFYYLFHKKIKDEIQKINFPLRFILLIFLQISFYLRIFLNCNLAKYFLKKIHSQFGKNMRFFISGGAKLDAKINRSLFKLGFIIYEGYGLTETSPVVTINPLNKIKIGSVGKAIPNVEIKILEQDRNGVGEISILGENVMRGYYKLPKETDMVLKNGQFLSGDLGYLDSKGYLYIVGRKKDLIILANGKNISPEEVENHYLQNPAIKEICVFLISQNLEEKIVAVIVPNFEYFQKKKLINIYDEIKWHLENISATLPTPKRIMGFILIQNNLPRTNLGKLKRYLIKEKYEKEFLYPKNESCTTEFNYSNEDLALLSHKTTREIFEILKAELSLQKKIALESHLELDLNLDSLRRLETISSIEKNLGIKIPESNITEIATVKDLIKIAIDLCKEENYVPKKISKPNFFWREILNAKLEKEIADKIEFNPNKISQFIYKISCGFISLFLNIFWHLKVYGRENLPKDQAFLICANHNSYLDGFIITAAIPKSLRKNLFFLILSTFFHLPLIRKIQKTIRIIPIDPSIHAINALKASVFILKNGKILAIFPEAVRSVDGSIQEFKMGTGILVSETNVTVIPTYIEGSFAAWPRTKILPKRHPIKIYFGKPFYFEKVEETDTTHNKNHEYLAAAKMIRKKILELQKGLTDDSEAR